MVEEDLRRLSRISVWLVLLAHEPVLRSIAFVYLTGVTVYVGAGSVVGLDENRLFFFFLANVCGLGVGKWVNNVGGAGSLIIICAFLASWRRQP